ncbi:hypothetical protein CBL_01767 [Carabus blaptoides fortunei]
MCSRKSEAAPGYSIFPQLPYPSDAHLSVPSVTNLRHLSNRVSKEMCFLKTILTKPVVELVVSEEYLSHNSVDLGHPLIPSLAIPTSLCIQFPFKKTTFQKEKGKPTDRPKLRCLCVPRGYVIK